MKFNLNTAIRPLLHKFFASINRYPLAILTAFFATVTLIIVNHYEGGAGFSHELLFQRLAMILALGFPVSLYLKGLQERQPNAGIMLKTMLWLAGAAFLVVYFLQFLKTMEVIPITRYIAVTAAFYLLSAVVPWHNRRDSFERFVIFLLARLLVTLIFATVLYLGLIAMLFAINSLFSAGISNKLYLDLYYVAVGIFSPLFFLADVPRHGEELPSTDFPKGLKIMLLYILTPILTAYSLILYAYFAKILFTRVWPAGMVANLVFWYAFAILAVIFLIFPIRNTDKLAKLCIAILPKAILPLIIMMIIAVGIRSGNFGITANRYFTFVAGTWLAACMVFLSIAKNPRNIVLPFSFAILAILSVFGPWSAFPVAATSQNLRFEKLLSKNGMLKDGVIVKSVGDVPDDDRKEISAILSYFKEYQSFAELKCLPANFNLFRTEKVFGFSIYEDGKRNPANVDYFFYFLEPQEIFSLDDFDYFVDLTGENATGYSAKTGKISIEYSEKAKLIRVYEEGKEIYKGSPQGMAMKISGIRERLPKLDATSMTIDDRNGQVQVRYLFRTIRGTVSKKTGMAHFEALRFYLFVKLNSE